MVKKLGILLVGCGTLMGTVCVQNYDPKLDEADMHREHVPDWRIASMARNSGTGNPPAV